MAVPGYELGDLIGEGAFGAVYRAVQPSLDREVAVKAIRAELADDPRFVQRFETEAQLVARLEHPARGAAVRLLAATGRRVPGVPAACGAVRWRIGSATAHSVWPRCRGWSARSVVRSPRRTHWGSCIVT